MELSAQDVRAPGRDKMHETGLFEQNREDMSVEEMERRRHSWTEGDLFAVFRDELGGTHVQYSPRSDFAHVINHVIINKNVNIDVEMIDFLVGILMISRLHAYSFENFVDLRDYKGNQIFDFKDLCEWIGKNEDLFITEAEIAAECCDDSMEDLYNDYDKIGVSQ
jgi:hypothetical protein